MADSLVRRFEHLSKRPRSDEARPLLEKIASQVKPIMTTRSWKVDTLAEFMPSNPALLGNNMNAGQRINLRLRPPGDPSNFYEYDQLVLVMLHELSHIEHGPHDAKFYKLLGELEEEYWDLKRKGYSGEGFHGAGNYLPGLKLNEYEGRARGLAAAQKRLDVQRKIGKGGVLGGAGTGGKSMKEVVAEAAERRLRDDKACHTENAEHAKEVEDEVRRAEEESVGVDAVELERGNGPEKRASISAGPATRQLTGVYKPTTNDRQSQQVPASSSLALATGIVNNGQPSPPHTRPPVSKSLNRPTSDRILTNPRPTETSIPNHLTPSVQPSAPPPNQPSAFGFAPTGEWSCLTCTLLNPPLALVCEACTAPKPQASRRQGGRTWNCDFCGAGPRGMEFWSCGECGWVRNWG